MANHTNYTDGERPRFSPRRTPCDRCGARRGLSVRPDGLSHCHACGVTTPPIGEPRRAPEGTPPREHRPAIPRKPPPEILWATPWELVRDDAYIDEAGVPLYFVARFERYVTTADNPGQPKREKTFVQRPAGTPLRQMNDRDRTPIGASLGTVRRVLLCLPAVVSAIRQGYRIWICEGEKCCEHLNDHFRHEIGLGDVATTCAGGARGWRQEYAESLRGADVIVWPDADAAGAALAHDVDQSLIGIAARVRIITPEIVRRVLS